jgi:hypothetical protein
MSISIKKTVHQGGSHDRYRYPAHSRLSPRRHSFTVSELAIFCTFWLLGFCSLYRASAADGLSAGPLYDHFYLTLTPGERTEAASPLFYSEQAETLRTWAVPPLISLATDKAAGMKELDILYPLLTYDRYGDQYRWQLCQLFSFSGGPSPTEDKRDRFTIFPLYFQQRSSDPAENYTPFMAGSNTGCSVTKSISSCSRFSANP